MHLIGKTLSELSPDELEEIVIFLDIDDTLGKAIEVVEINTDTLHECTPGCRIVYVFSEEKDTYVFCYYIKYENQWKRMVITFRFREAVFTLLQYFKEKKIEEVYLLSAAAEEYIEGIQYILQVYYHFNIKGYISVCNVQQQIILERIEGQFKQVLYMEKDMVKAMNQLEILPGKIPILLDDKPYWGRNGYVIPIIEEDHIDTYISKPIQSTREPLFTIFE